MAGVEWQAVMPGMRAIVRAPDEIRTIQVYGQRCSGTNALIKMIEANLPSGTFTEVYGFKHWFVPPQILFRSSTLVLVIARDAVTWLQSVHRQPWHLDPATKDLPFGAFIRSEWASYWDSTFWGVDHGHPIHATEMMHERDPDTGARFGNAVKKRTAKLAHWANLHRRAHNLCLIDQGRVQDDPEAVMRALSLLTGLPLAHGFVPVETYKGNGIRPFRPYAYPPVSAADLAFIADNLDADVEALYGLSPPSIAAAVPPERSQGLTIGVNMTGEGRGAVPAMVRDL